MQIIVEYADGSETRRVMLLTLALLGFRVQPGIAPGQFWQLDSL